MSDKPAGQRRIQDFPGFLLEVEPQDQPAGAASEQVNAISTDIGVLQSRGGYDVLTFEGE